MISTDPLAPASRQFPLGTGPRTATENRPEAVSFGFGQMRQQSLASALDLTGIVYDPQRQVSTLNGAALYDLPQMAGTQYTTREDSQIWTDRD